MRRRYYNTILYILTVHTESSASVTVGSKVMVTNNDGYVTFKLRKGSYQYNIYKSGFVQEIGSVLLDSDKTIDIQLYPSVTPSIELFTTSISNKELSIKSKYISFVMFGGGGGGAATSSPSYGHYPGGGSSGECLFIKNILTKSYDTPVIISSFYPGKGGYGGKLYNPSADDTDNGDAGTSSSLSLFIDTSSSPSYTAVGGNPGNSQGNGGNGVGTHSSPGGGAGCAAGVNGTGAGSSGNGIDGYYCRSDNQNNGGPGGNGKFNFKGGGTNGGIANVIKDEIVPLSSIFKGSGKGGSSAYGIGSGGGGYGDGGSRGYENGGLGAGGAGKQGSLATAGSGGNGCLCIYYHNQPI